MALSLQRYTWPDSRRIFDRLLKERIKLQQERRLSEEIVSNKVDHLPENLIIEILSWLPVKDLLQFKTVCKLWNDIITSPHFISKHLKNYYKHNYDKQCLLAQYYVSHAELQLFQLLVDETPRILGYEILYHVPMYSSYIYGPCNGIYYLYDYNFQRALWNPALNELRVLPELISKLDLPTNIRITQHEFYGFGLDPETNDYKVVILKGYWKESEFEDEPVLPQSAFVYSFREDKWRYWGDLSHGYNLENNKSYVCAKGCLFWPGSRLQPDNIDAEVILAYDMAADIFQEIQVPCYDDPAYTSLGLYDDSLAFYSFHEDMMCLDIWSLNEGVWTRKFSSVSIFEVQEPIGHWMNNKVILEGKDRSLFLCDPETDEVLDLGFQRSRMCEGVFSYRESLVSIRDKNKGKQRETEKFQDSC